MNAQLQISSLTVGPMDNNAYLLRCTNSGEQLLIDAADEADRLLAWIGDNGVRQVVTTHGHPDHWQALAAVVRATGASTLAGAADAEALPVTVDERVDSGSVISVGACELEVIGLVGHTPGSIAVAYTDPAGLNHIFTGDSLFPGGVGKTWSDEDFARLIDDVEHRLFDRFDDSTRIYPGHGAGTTLGAERPHLHAWRARGW